MIDTTISLGTDVATLLIFHSDDLAHAAGWPITWYADPVIYSVESAAGRLMAWQTRSDGGYAVRLTDGELSDRERAYAGPSWTFPLTVRHGRVFVDNSDGLPGVERMIDPADFPEQWVDVPNSDYAVTVTGIEWRAEPGVETMGDAALPTYVVVFTPAVEPPPPARRPPDLEPYRDAIANDAVVAPNRRPAVPIAISGPLAALATDQLLPPPHSFSVDTAIDLASVLAPSADPFDKFDRRFVIVPDAASIAQGSLGVIASLNGSGFDLDGSHRYGLTAEGLCRINAVDGWFSGGTVSPLRKSGLLGSRDRPVPPNAPLAVRVTQIMRPNSQASLSPAVFDAAKSQVVAALMPGGSLAETLGPLASHEALQVSAFCEDWLLDDWLMRHLPMPATHRLALMTQPADQRIIRLAEKL